MRESRETCDFSEYSTIIRRVFARITAKNSENKRFFKSQAESSRGNARKVEELLVRKRIIRRFFESFKKFTKIFKVFYWNFAKNLRKTRVFAEFLELSLVFTLGFLYRVLAFAFVSLRLLFGEILRKIIL